MKKADESLLPASYEYLNGKQIDCHLSRLLNQPIISNQNELEIMTRDRDFEIDKEWRKQPWMKNYPQKINLNK